MRLKYLFSTCGVLCFVASAVGQQPATSQNPKPIAQTPAPTQNPKPAAQTPAPAPSPPTQPNTQAPAPAPVPRAVVPTRPPAPTIPPPAANAVACTVNGQAIPEMAVYRGLKYVPADKQAQARTDILKFLVDNTLIDQHLEQQQKIVVAPQEIDAKVTEIREEVKKQGSTFEKMLEEFLLTEAEIRKQIAAQLRWDRFVSAQATDQTLRQLFDSNRTLFDGTLVRARHILFSPAANDQQAHAAAKARLAEIKTAVQKKTTDELAKLPAQTDNAAREAAKAKSMEETFGEFAVKESACPSKAQGGNLGWFPFSSMVESFAKVAFALKPYEMSDVVTTQFGYHLILVTENRPGKEPKFDEVKADVKEIFVERLRDSLCGQLRQSAKVVMNQPTKP